jgi:transposase
MAYSEVAWERAMKVQEVIMKALTGELHWYRAADILGLSARTLRRWRERYEEFGYDGLLDRRRRTPSRKRVPVAEVTRVVTRYRDRYRGFNGRHFHQIARREHGITLSYSFVKAALQLAGLLKKGRARGRHRRRREPRGCFGELLHIDGSPHAWLALRPDERSVLSAVLDDATKRVLYAQLWPSETATAIMTALRDVIATFGLPMAVYTDRAHWAFNTPQAKGPVDKTQLTQVGRALDRLGIEHIPAYSPQARGRSERLNRTFQDRLVNALRVAKITTLAAANAYLRDHFVPDYNTTFSCAPADPSRAFVAVGSVDLDQILCHEDQRTVARDNTVAFDGHVFQLDRQRDRRSCSGLRVTIRRHLTGGYSIWCGTRRLGHYPVQPEAPRVHRAAVRPMDADRDRGTPRDVTPPTPPGIRVRTTAVRPVEASDLLEIRQSKRVEVSTWKRPAQRRRQRHPPRSAIAAGRQDGILGVDASLPQLPEAGAGSRPLFPDDSAKPPPNPLVKTAENRRRFAEAEIRPPPEQVRSQFLHHLVQAHTTHPSRERPDSCSKPDQRLLGEAPFRSLAMREAEAQKRSFSSCRHRAFGRIDVEFEPRRDEARDARHHAMACSLAADVHIAVVCIPNEAVAATFELAVKRV